MRKLTFAVVFVFALAIAASAQYAGWTIPDGGKDEKSPLKPSPDLVKKGKSLFTTNCQKCHGPLGKGDGPDSPKDEPAADLTDEFRYELNPEGVLDAQDHERPPPGDAGVQEQAHERRCLDAGRIRQVAEEAFLGEPP